MKNAVYIVVLTFVVILTSCTPSSKLTSSWKPEESESKLYSKIGVMVLSPKTTNRLAAEDVIVTKFKEKNVTAAPTYDVFPLAGKIEMPVDTSAESKALMAKFVQKVKDNNYDALMMVTMIDEKKSKDMFKECLLELELEVIMVEVVITEIIITEIVRLMLVLDMQDNQDMQVITLTTWETCMSQVIM